MGIFQKKITKKDLEALNAWEEVKGWFELVNDMIKKVSN